MNMKYTGATRTTVFIGCWVLSLIFGVGGWVKFLDLRIRVALAEEQTRYCEETLRQAGEQPSSVGVSDYIHAIELYYPSGTKQRVGSHVDLMVERARSNSIYQLRHIHPVPKALITNGVIKGP